MRGGLEKIRLGEAPKLWGYMGTIMKTKIKLLDLAGMEKDSTESLLANMLSFLDDLGATKGATLHGKDLIDHRRRILHGLIGEPGGWDAEGKLFEDLHLERFAAQAKSNPEVFIVILGLAKVLAEKFVAENPEAAKDIADDNEYKNNPKKYDHVGNYISQGVLEMLGIPAD